MKSIYTLKLIKEYEIHVEKEKLQQEYSHLYRKFLKMQQINPNLLFTIEVDKEKGVIKVKQTVLEDGSNN